MNSRKGTKFDGYIILKIFWNEYYWFYSVTEAQFKAHQALIDWLL